MKIFKRPIIYILLSSFLFSLFITPVSAHEREGAAQVSSSSVKLIPGGNSFGVKIYADGLIAVGFAEVEDAEGSKTPALDAGMKLHDIINRVDGQTVTTAEDFVKYIENCGGKDVEIEFRRGDRQMKAVLHPSRSAKDGKYRIGMWLRDSTAGIGTVTFVMPDNLCFGGLGHGICDSSSGELVPLSHGSIADVTITSVIRGMSGTPGELKGSFSSGKRGALISNTDNGVFGAYSSLPEELKDHEALDVATRDEICDGDAQIYCTLGDDGIGCYGIKISDINKEDKTSKSFMVTVTDEKLIERTGGIVQGMSGSPIIQNGKIVGAVTHVLVNDPTRGYGIFIENMLAAAG